ncbi:hypothetical protein J2S74_005105 [Evansella vedderi]|uniref:Uncharacterized protein n=1 Tax=Evansella vedderi TaxID=38282 RepID=A0ABU0A2C3_9BACI|nr:hypothetical protein [Evansella vedderi]
MLELDGVTYRNWLRGLVWVTKNSTNLPKTAEAVELGNNSSKKNKTTDKNP